MKKYSYTLLIIISISSCAEVDPKPESGCIFKATVIDISEIGGCSRFPWFGLALQADNGNQYEPVNPLDLCATPPVPPADEDNALRDFELKAGQRVLFGFRNSDHLSTCEIGVPVFITCIKEIENGIVD